MGGDDQMSTALASVEHSDDSEGPEGSDEIVVLTPLVLEARAVRTGAPWADVRRVGMGPRRAARSAQLTAANGNRPILIAGFCGALDPQLEPGDIVLATELRGRAGGRHGIGLVGARLSPASADHPARGA
jgi:nucleoside phosphorylase